MWWLYARWVSALTSTRVAPAASMCASACMTYWTCASIMNTIELWPRPGIGADEEEQVREARDRRAAGRLGAAVPLVPERGAGRARDAVREAGVGDVEARREDDRAETLLSCSTRSWGSSGRCCSARATDAGGRAVRLPRQPS